MTLVMQGDRRHSVAPRILVDGGVVCLGGSPATMIVSMRLYLPRNPLAATPCNLLNKSTMLLMHTPYVHI